VVRGFRPRSVSTTVGRCSLQSLPPLAPFSPGGIRGSDAAVTCCHLPAAALPTRVVRKVYLRYVPACPSHICSE